MKQLTLSSLPLPQIKVKFLGSTGAGKSLLIETLKCGLLSGLFRRSRLSSHGNSPNSKGDKGRIEWCAVLLNRSNFLHFVLAYCPSKQPCSC